MIPQPRKPVKDLFISRHDYANFSHNMANALRKVSSGVYDITLNPHKFGYESQSTMVKHGDMERMIERAERVHLMHSDPLLFKMWQRFRRDSKLIVWHTGTRYRQNPDNVNAMFNPHVKLSMLALTEFDGLGAKNPHYIVGAIDTDQLKPERYYNGGTPQIYHLPSDPETKGTEAIFQIVRSLNGNFNFEYKLTASPHKQQLQLMQKCDIYLELFATHQNGKPYGSWGITALEAAAMGKIVFTQMNKPEVYERTYGELPELWCYQRQNDWILNIQSLLNTPSVITSYQEDVRKWVENFHSFQATGKKMLEIFGSI